MNSHDFKNLITLSKVAVHEIIKSYEAWGHWLIVDVQDKEEYFSKDIDLIVDDCIFIEVKTDRSTHSTGNLFCEWISNCQNGKLGWVQATEADYIHYVEYCRNNEYSICHCFNTSDLREFIDNNKSDIPFKRCWDKDDNKYKLAYLVKVDEVKKFKSYDSFLLKLAI